jgi:PilZ domain
MSRPGVDALPLNALVTVRVADDETDYPSRIEDVADDSIFVAAPTGANAVLVATGRRQVEVSWLSPRGRYQQGCELVQIVSGRPRLWRLRPARDPWLIQRRRFVRVRASIPVALELQGGVSHGTTVDISEGGFRIRVPRQPVEELAPAGIRATLAGIPIVVDGYVVRSTACEPSNAGEPEQIDVVVAFDLDLPTADAIRWFVFQLQLASDQGVR